MFWQIIKSGGSRSSSSSGGGSDGSGAPISLTILDICFKWIFLYEFANNVLGILVKEGISHANTATHIYSPTKTL